MIINKYVSEITQSQFQDKIFKYSIDYSINIKNDIDNLFNNLKNKSAFIIGYMGKKSISNVGEMCEIVVGNYTIDMYLLEDDYYALYIRNNVYYDSLIKKDNFYLVDQFDSISLIINYLMCN